MDLHETDKAFIMHAELPGVDKDAIKVSIANGMLTVSAERKGEVFLDSYSKIYDIFIFYLVV